MNLCGNSVFSNKRLGSFRRNDTIRDRAFTETEIWSIKSMFYDVWMKIWEKLKANFSLFVWLNFQSIETFSYVEIIYIFYSTIYIFNDLTLSLTFRRINTKRTTRMYKRMYKTSSLILETQYFYTYVLFHHVFAKFWNYVVFFFFYIYTSSPHVSSLFFSTLLVAKFRVIFPVI